MPDLANADSHELYVWDAEELLEQVKKLKEGVRVAVEANEWLKGFIDADAVALFQLIQAGDKIAKQVKLLGILGNAYIKEVKGKKYIIFKGNQRLRPDLKGTRYLAENAKVKCFVVGTKDIIEDAAKGTKVAIVAFIALDIAMECTSDHFSLASLGVRIGSDVLQAVVSTAVGVEAGVFVAAAFGAPVVITFIVVVGAGFLMGMLLTNLDNRYHLTERLRARMMSYEQELGREIPVIKQAAVNAGHKAAQLGREAGSAIKADFYKVDRFFASTAQMMQSEGLSPWYGL